MSWVKEIIRMDRNLMKPTKREGRFSWEPLKKWAEKYRENSRLEYFRPKEINGRTAYYRESPSVMCIDKEWDIETHVPRTSDGVVVKGWQISLSECKKCEFYTKGFCQKKIDRHGS